MSEEWPDDDARFTGPGCLLDKIGGLASGEAFMAKKKKTAKKMFAVCELVQMLVCEHGSGVVVVENAARVTIVMEFEHEYHAGVAAAEHAVKLEESSPEGYKATVAVIPVWRMR